MSGEFQKLNAIVDRLGLAIQKLVEQHPQLKDNPDIQYILKEKEEKDNATIESK